MPPTSPPDLSRYDRNLIGPNRNPFVFLHPLVSFASLVLISACYVWGCTTIDLLGLAMLIATAALLAWLGIRAWWAKHSFLKWGGARLAALLSTAATLASVIMIVGLSKLNARTAPTLDLKISATPAQIQRCQAITDGFCSGYHSRTGTLTGSLNVGEDLPVSIGSFVSSNLTPAGQLSRGSDGDIFRAIRNGVDPDGDNLTGGVPGQLGPHGPDLNLVKGWKLEEFIATMRTGRGSQWPSTQQANAVATCRKNG
jgi:hypothetical protein